MPTSSRRSASAELDDVRERGRAVAHLQMTDSAGARVVRASRLRPLGAPPSGSTAGPARKVAHPAHGRLLVRPGPARPHQAGARRMEASIAPADHPPRHVRRGGFRNTVPRDPVSATKSPISALWGRRPGGPGPEDPRGCLPNWRFSHGRTPLVPAGPVWADGDARDRRKCGSLAFRGEPRPAAHRTPAASAHRRVASSGANPGAPRTARPPPMLAGGALLPAFAHAAWTATPLSS